MRISMMKTSFWIALTLPMVAAAWSVPMQLGLQVPFEPTRDSSRGDVPRAFFQYRSPAPECSVVGVSLLLNAAETTTRAQTDVTTFPARSWPTSCYRGCRNRSALGIARLETRLTQPKLTSIRLNVSMVRLAPRIDLEEGG
jgi:hypothetical protein